MAPPRLSFFLAALHLMAFGASVVAPIPVGEPRVAEAASMESWKRGKILYTERCFFCHGEDGRGWPPASKVARPPVPVPDLTDPAFIRRFRDEELFRVIKEGGTRKGKSRFMPPAGRWLGDDDIRDVITYLRSLERRPEGEKK